jgi:hypothetical protein
MTGEDASSGRSAARFDRLAAASDWLVLRGHGLARRFDAIPQEFGAPDGIDEDDPKALRAEWLRQLRLWADYNPEEVFALKVGGGLLLAAVAALWLAIGTIR